MADEVYMKVNSEKHRRIILRRYTLNSYLGCTTIIDEGAEDICISSEGRGTELEGVWSNPRGNKNILVLNKEEKKKRIKK